MTPEDRQAERLRMRLDHELDTVHATTEARERLDSRLSPSTGSPPIRWNRRRLPIALALPLAAASVVVAVVAVPALLRSDSGAPASNGDPQPPSPAPAPTRTAAPQPAPGPEQSSRETTTPADDNTRLRLAPTAVEPGQRVVVTVLNLPAQFGDLTVDWADGSRNTVVRHSCASRSPATSAPPAHSYARAGTYRVRVTIGHCDNARAVPVLTRRLTVSVATARASARTG